LWPRCRPRPTGRSTFNHYLLLFPCVMLGSDGHTFSQPDLIIAATAIHYDLTVVTRDRSDYGKARVSVINPWEAT